MRDNMKQIKFKILEFLYYLKYRKHIPKGVRRNLIELTIFLGELTALYKVNKLNIEDKNLKECIDTAEQKIVYLEEYLDYLKGKE